MFNFQRHTSYFLLLTSYLFISSCSIQKQLTKSANEDVLSDKALQTAHVGISIFEPAANKYWFNYQGDKYFVPASNTKLPTCYAAMKYLGDSLAGLRYSYRKDSNTFYILPTADPTFLHPDFKLNPALDFYKNNIGKKFILNISAIWFETPLGNGWSWNDYNADYMAERSPFPIYGNVVKFSRTFNSKIPISDSETGIYVIGSLKVFPKYFEKNITVVSVEDSNNIRINRPIAENKYEIRYSKNRFNSVEIPFITDNEQTYAKLLSDTIGAHIGYTGGDNDLGGYFTYNNGKLYTRNNNWLLNTIDSRKIFQIIHSQPTDSLLKPMMHRSDNFFAEQSLLMVSNEMLGVMNDEKVIDTLLKTDFKDLPQKPRWADGSGLSRYNLFTPQDFVSILNKMKNEFGMERIKVILPTGGEGTISSYYKADSGYIYGKTGTLSGVVAFSGFLYTKKGKLLIFSTLVNNHQASATEVRQAIEKFLQEIRNKY
jgi:D-alanyl-D-alanine carboxypeptidase/D-alanyl-D-alanine-endopeptidase (penicillin-binding protein 4)